MTTTRSGLRLRGDQAEGHQGSSSSNSRRTDTQENDLNTSNASVGSSLNDSFAKRQSRLEEKEQLHDLNRRLQSYILKKRNDDAQRHMLVRTIEKAKAENADNLRDLRRTMQLEIDEITTERNMLREELASLRALLDGVDSAKARHSEEVTEANERVTVLTCEVESLTQRLREANALNTRLVSDCRTLEKKAHKASSSHDRLNTQLSHARSKADGAAREALQARTAADTANVDLQRVRAQLKAVQKQIKQERDSHQRVMDETREKFEAEFSENLKASQEQADADNKTALAELREAYDGKLTSLRRVAAAAQTDVDAARAAEAEATEEKETLVRQVNMVREEVSKLRDEVSTLRKAPQKKQQALRDQITKLRAEVFGQQEQIDTLYDTKIMLSKELEVYEKLMDAEDRRLDARRSKKRRRTTPAPAAAASPATMEDVAESKVPTETCTDSVDEPAKNEQQQPGTKEGDDEDEDMEDVGAGAPSAFAGGAAPTPEDVQASPASPTTINGKPILYIADIDSSTSALEIRSCFSKEDTDKRAVPLDGWSLRTVKEPSEQIYFPAGCSVDPGKPFHLVQCFDGESSDELGFDRSYLVELDGEAMDGRDLTKLDIDDALILVSDAGVEVHRVIVGDFQRRKSCLIM